MLGVLIGSVGAKILGVMTQMPISISWLAIFIGVAFSSLIGIIAGIQPAKRAAVLQPVVALK